MVFTKEGLLCSNLEMVFGKEGLLYFIFGMFLPGMGYYDLYMVIEMAYVVVILSDINMSMPKLFKLFANLRN